MQAQPGRRQRIVAGLRTARARFRQLERRDRACLLAWVLAIGVLAVFRIGVEERLHPSEALVPSSDAGKAKALSDRYFGPEQLNLVLLKGPPEVLDRRGPAIADRIAALQHFRVLDPWRGGGKALRPKQGEAVLLVSIGENFDQGSISSQKLRKLLKDDVGPPLEAHLTGFADINYAMKVAAVSAVEKAELVAAPLLVIVLLLVLGSPIAAAMPLFLGGCVALAGGGLLDLLNRFVTPLEIPAISVGAAMALALGVDYSLLLVARFRRELAAGADVREASDIALSQAGRTVLFAGGVLAAAMTTAMLATPAAVLKSATAGVLVATGLSLIGARVALPPLLRWAGHDINRYQVVSPGAESGRWSALALSILRRPARSAVVVLGIMLALAAPALGLVTGPPDPRVLPSDSPARKDFEAIEHSLGASRAMPFIITVVAKNGTLADRRLGELARFERQLRSEKGTAQALGPATVARRTAALATVPGKLRKASRSVHKGQKGVGRLEAGLARAAGGADQLVSGLSAAADGSAKLHAGNMQAESGAQQLNAGAAAAHSGAGQLTGGLTTALSGARKLDLGSRRARDGAGTIAEKLHLAARKTRAALPGATQLADGLTSGAKQLRALKEPADIANKNASQALHELDSMLVTSKADPAYARAYKNVATVAGALSGKNPVTGEPVRAGYHGLPAALGDAASQASLAAAGARQLRDGIQQLADGLDRLAAGGDQLEGGLKKLAAGNSALAGGAERLVAGSRQLESGLGKLSGGTQQLLSGLGQLSSGSGTLAAKLGEGRGKAGPLVGGLGKLHQGAQTFGKQTGELGKGLDRASKLAPVFGSGYAKIAAIQTAPRAQAAAAGWAINWDRGGNAVHIMVAQRASYGDGASTKGNPSFADNPYRTALKRRVAALGKRLDATAIVGGPAAGLADFDQAAKSSLPLLVLVLALVTYLALVVILRSLVLPLIAVLLNVITLLASFGVLAFAFGPDGVLGGTGWVDDIMVMVIYTLTFALSIDYAVFLLDRMREGWDRTHSVESAIAYGVEGTAGVITGAAAIMAAVFLAFMTASVSSLQELGLGLTTAVILDATLIRLVLLPAAIRLAGERAWHTPRWLDAITRPGRGRDTMAATPGDRELAAADGSSNGNGTGSTRDLGRVTRV